MVHLGVVLGLPLAATFVEAATFNPLQWLGANGQWYPGKLTHQACRLLG